MVEKQVSVYPYVRLPGTIMVPAKIADDRTRVRLQRSRLSGGINVDKNKNIQDI